MSKLEKTRFDLLITGIGLPGGTGLEIVQQARLQQSGLRGIALSGFGTEHDLHRSEEAGFSAHIVKPIDIEQLNTTIRRSLEPGS
ncbi:MAG: response regulator [Verrucomicrobia bacterium]|nr:response regulator [Verrucomicrobiota bacterium]MBV8483181.1 response regulator [Verrucomicrobiota bacterium]